MIIKIIKGEDLLGKYIRENGEQNENVESIDKRSSVYYCAIVSNQCLVFRES